MSVKHVDFGKIPRLNRDIVITEKIDGANSAIHIVEDPYKELVAIPQSRNRIITPEKDNHGFARWVRERESELIETLGEGIHFGEFWGMGIQRKYGLKEKRFSLFNTSRWNLDNTSSVEGLSVVPVLYEGPFDTHVVNDKVRWLKGHGSLAAPGFMNPEGVIVFHTAANSMFKVTCEKDEQHKWQS